MTTADTSAAAKFKDFGTLKEHLSECKTKTGDDLYKHMSDILGHILVHCPEDALNMVEEVSYIVKHKDRL